MKSKQSILNEILHQNSQLLKFDHYFNDTTDRPLFQWHIKQKRKYRGG